MTDVTQQAEPESFWSHVRDAFAAIGRALHVVAQDAPIVIAVAEAVAPANPQVRTAVAALNAAQQLVSLAQAGAADHPAVVDAVSAVAAAHAVAVAAGAPKIADQIAEAEPVAAAVDAVEAAKPAG